MHAYYAGRMVLAKLILFIYYRICFIIYKFGYSMYAVHEISAGKR